MGRWASGGARAELEGGQGKYALGEEQSRIKESEVHRETKRVLKITACHSKVYRKQKSEEGRATR
jgi:hypothetical protein